MARREDGDDASEGRSTSRRDFLRASGIGVAGAAAGALGVRASHGDPNAEHGFAPLPARPEPGFDHVVVLMFENRSFDHMLGRLYADGEVPRGQSFEGLQIGDHADVAPDGTVVPAHVYAGSTDRIMAQPDPDPGEYYSHFAPEMLPVLSTIARGSGVYDHWHCAVPSQTFCNRSFFHASTSHGFVTNVLHGGQSKWLEADAVPTIFDRLEEAGRTWRVYYDAEQVVSLTGMLHAPSIERYWRTNLRGMEQFHADAAAGRLPDYASIEPRMVFDHDDMHPPVTTPRASDADETRTSEHAVSDMRAGEALLAEVYTSIRSSASAHGSNAMNTALLVTFDEHGGIDDHVPPPAATPPYDDEAPGEMGFRFDRLGPRVPAIVVSAYTAEGSVLHDPMHHGSLVRTLCEQHGLAPLTRRDADAPSLRTALTLDRPRQPALWPGVHRPYVPPNPESGGPRPTDDERRHRPLTPPALGLIGLLLARYEPDAPLPVDHGDAYEVLHRHGDGLFGVHD